ncbi:hypothetical protein MSG28_003033 [Choristoneura fumiferana]|uniref:Uncharacterized protein n=1 Tax=Choristoneura fumiferana TaxID=7141 RepID=A0ACC0JL54_CHOFU|nr:hypothetical protein MSG28_003033 [Choristoneura fumiferana]
MNDAFRVSSKNYTENSRWTLTFVYHTISYNSLLEIMVLGTMMDKQLVWVRDPTDGFVLARIQELMGEEVDVLPLDNRHPRRVTNFDDLMFLNEATLLNNIVERYKKNKIYTYVANILLAVNPYRELADLYSSATIKRYQGKSLGELPPHSIIVSGESGAGKTESTKYILKYLCDLWAKGAGPVEQKILDANPILEAFGNAKTTRNNNSSRFGKFMEVHFSNKYQVVGGHISHYLLEKSRICTQSAEERNYHVFYLLCAGAPQDLRTALKITKPDDYSKSVYSVVAAVLHLGNVEFEEEGGARGGCHVAPGSEGSLATAAALLGVDGGELRMALVSRLMQSSRGGIKGTAIIFEQFCINYCNEKLQQFFNERILKNEQELYKREGLVSQFIEKNNDALHASLEFLVQESGCGLVQQLFRNTDNNNAKGKLNFISPNSRMVALAAEGALVLTQLQCNGTTAVLELMEHGFPSRAPFNDLHRMYAQYLPPRLQMLAPKVFAEFGLTRVFFRPGKYSEFDTIMRSDPDNLRSVIHKVLAWLVKSRWRRSIFAYRRQCLITIQTQVRGYLVRRRHRPRIRGVAKIRALEENLKKMETSNDKISSAEIDQLYSKLTRDVEERLRKIEAEMRAAEEAKRLEMERVRQEEENRRLKAEMEARRKAEEAERQRQEASDRAGAARLQQQLEHAARADQDNRERSERIRMQQAMQGKQKHDLSKWKYSELRDTINTSCDIELLEACRHEFHRRLKVYHAWKAKNARKTTMNEQERAPQSIMDAVIPKLELIEKLETWESNPDIIPSPKQRAGKKKCINPAVFQKTFLLLKPDIHIVAFREEVLWLRQVPFVRRKIEKKMAEINRDFKADVTKRLAGVTIRRTLPEKGLSAEEVTTGGTESIMMACKAFRDLAYSKGISNPQMVLPSTAHSAFDKAAQYLGLAVVVVKVNQETMTVDVDDVRRAIGRRTCLIVGSAPNFPYGTMDDINALSDLALECDVPLHVDACLGGFVAAFMPDAGHPVPYGFAPKGTSVVLYRKPEYRHCQYTVTTEWPGGVYGSPTVNGSRAGGLIAACWATMVFVGRSRYVTMADEILTRARTVIRLVCNFAPRGPAGELWLPAAPGAACPTHTQRDTQLPNLCNQANLTSNIGPSNDMTLKERSLLNAVLEIERNQLLEHPGSLDELYLTNMAIATLNHPVTTESYFKTTYKQDIIESTIFEDDKQIDKARNSIRETTKVISKMEHKNRRPKTTKLITRLSMVGRPKSYDVEELEDPYMEGYANTRSVETATLNEKDLYAEYEEQDISETTAEYDIKTTLKDAVVSTTMSISELELYSTGLFNSNDINNSYNISTTIVLVRPTHVNTFQEQPMDQAKQSDPTTEKWAGTLRRRDPDIQPTLPSIVSRKTSTASSMGSGRKTRSVERIPKTSRARQLVPIKPIPRKSDIPAEAGDVTIFEKDEKVFDATGYELHLVETLERDILQKNPDVRWRDVIGLDDAKSVLQEAMVLPLVMPDYFKAAFYAPSTIFLDEVDSLCAVRGADSEHEASRRFKAELLIQMDGLSAVFHRDKIIMVLAATNHPWDIDEAFRRRFEKRIYIGLPDETTRVKLLKLCLREVVLADDVDLKDLASKLDGYSGDAAMMTMRRKIAGKSPDQIRHLKRSELEAPISRDDLAAATDKTRRTVSQADVARYTGWMQRHGCS